MLSRWRPIVSRMSYICPVHQPSPEHQGRFSTMSWTWYGAKPSLHVDPFPEIPITEIYRCAKCVWLWSLLSSQSRRNPSIYCHVTQILLYTLASVLLFTKWISWRCGLLLHVLLVGHGLQSIQYMEHPISLLVQCSRDKLWTQSFLNNFQSTGLLYVPSCRLTAIVPGAECFGLYAVNDSLPIEYGQQELWTADTQHGCWNVVSLRVLRVSQLTDTLTPAWVDGEILINPDTWTWVEALIFNCILNPLNNLTFSDRVILSVMTYLLHTVCYAINLQSVEQLLYLTVVVELSGCV